jgi:hypothetical protein
LTAHAAALSGRRESPYHENTQFALQSFTIKLCEDLAMSHGFCSVVLSIPRSLAMAVLVPTFAAVTAAVLLGLLGVFVVWLCIVAVLVTTIVAADLAHRLMRRLAPAPIAARSAVSVPGR